MQRPSKLVRLGWAMCVLAGLGSAQAAWMPDDDDGPAPRASPPAVLDSFIRDAQPCTSAMLVTAVQLIHEQDEPEQASALAEQCNREARLQGHAVKRLIAVRIQALLAMRFRDLAALRQAGQALIQQREVPAYVPDGHMCLAFTCLAQGDTVCARQHLSLARTQFTALQIPHALDQLVPLEQALLHMEGAESAP